VEEVGEGEADEEGEEVVEEGEEDEEGEVVEEEEEVGVDVGAGVPSVTKK
jgi:hypothetical protein